ncbi:MAG: hypothetical protein RLN70_03810 [Rhodospirillaceae bacterium]
MAKDAGFNALNKHRKRIAQTDMREMFALDPNRFQRFSATGADILLDYSKNRIDEEVMDVMTMLLGLSSAVA